MEPTALRYEDDGPIATLTFNRPETVNAMNLTMIAELKEVFLKPTGSAEQQKIA